MRDTSPGLPEEGVSQHTPLETYSTIPTQGVQLPEQAMLCQSRAVNARKLEHGPQVCSGPSAMTFVFRIRQVFQLSALWSSCNSIEEKSRTVFILVLGLFFRSSGTNHWCSKKTIQPGSPSTQHVNLASSICSPPVGSIRFLLLGPTSWHLPGSGGKARGTGNFKSRAQGLEVQS